MIALRDVYKSYKTLGGRKVILDGVSCEFPPGVNVGILGRNGAGKSTLIRLISGTERPDSGAIQKIGRVSWPLGFKPGLHNKLSARNNLRFLCRLYGEDYGAVVDFVEDFTDIGEYFDMPILTYSTGMKAKLIFGISMGFRFDYYLMDEVTEVGDAVFREKSRACFAERRKSATLLVVSHNITTIRSFCDKGMVLHDGQLRDFPDIAEAEAYYLKECCGQPEAGARKKARAKRIAA